MIKVARSFALVCVVGVGAGLFSLALGLTAGSVASAAAADTIDVLSGSSIPFVHLLAAVAVVCLSVTALRMIGDLEPRGRMRELPLNRSDDDHRY